MTGMAVLAAGMAVLAAGMATVRALFKGGGRTRPPLSVQRLRMAAALVGIDCQGSVYNAPKPSL